MWLYQDLFICSPIEEHPDCFQFFGKYEWSCYKPSHAHFCVDILFLISTKSNISTFLFYRLCFWYYILKFITNFKITWIFPLFPSTNVTPLCFISKFVIQFNSFFVKSVESVARLFIVVLIVVIILHVDTQLFQHQFIFLKKSFLHWIDFNLLSKMGWLYLYGYFF